MRDPSAVLDRSGLARFCVAICHDVRGPVATAGAAIQRLATLLPLEPGPGGAAAQASGGAGAGSRAGDDGVRLLEIAQESIARAEELLASLPGLLAAERCTELSDVPLEAVVRAALEDVELELSLAGGRVRVASRLPVVLGHRERLRIALRNLLRNAIRYRRSGLALEVELRALRRGPWRTLVVADNGIGIPRAERARLFAPLHRVAAGGGSGSGLGLALARHAVEACGGTIAVSSRPGRGASFAITLRAAGSAG